MFCKARCTVQCILYSKFARRAFGDWFAIFPTQRILKRMKNEAYVLKAFYILIFYTYGRMNATLAALLFELTCLCCSGCLCHCGQHTSHAAAELCVVPWAAPSFLLLSNANTQVK